jgi:dTDP-4-amino-4,6-dideoxygalactose transaminase
MVDFVDINPHSYNICVDALEEKLKNARATGNLPKILVAVHLCGQSCDMEAINKLSVIYGFNVIEDASHAIGGKYKGENIGTCKYSDITVFSFHPVKIITTAEGGMALTNDDRLASMMNLLRSHGITRDENLMVDDSHGPWYYEQLELGFNYRMTELQAALGVSQLSRLDDFVAKRHDLAGQYNNSLADLPVILPWQDPDSYSSYHLYVIRIKTGETRKSHREIFECLRDQGIGVNLHYIPVYLHPYYRQMGYTQGYCIEAERYYSDAISIPLYPNLTKDNQLLVVNALRRACSS